MTQLSWRQHVNLNHLKEIRLTLASPNEPSLLEIERDWRFSDAILGFEWSFSGEFVLITSTGIELYRVSRA